MFGKKKKDEIPENVLEAANLKNEDIELWVKGAEKEWLICTDNQVYIVKKGFMTGHTFGFGVFQMPYKNITGANVNYHLATGYFEISAGGMQNTQKDYWSHDKNSDPHQAQNCISVAGKEMANKFREASSYILNKAHEFNSNNSPTNNIVDIPEQIKKLADLKTQGILTEEEFNKKKSELLAKM
ncbi:SHOCT domain-containing protein [Clostridium sp. Mt-5]|uniref:SHOCT domain-containing protein n=1 Tax=Clostridium moutaii TaxID=3240932 RepID=A0ABV4BUA1_9CLOT